MCRAFSARVLPSLWEATTLILDRGLGEEELLGGGGRGSGVGGWLFAEVWAYVAGDEGVCGAGARWCLAQMRWRRSSIWRR